MDSFQQRKNDVLSKSDKSSIGKWDKKILKLCKKINSLENYYTTSSCSGRILVMQDKEKKAPNLFELISHNTIDYENFMKSLPKKFYNLNFKFKQEPLILHIMCKDLESAKKLLKSAQLSGWKRSGIIFAEKRIAVELLSTEKLEFPLVYDGELLVNEKFLKIVLKKANENLKRGWKKIQSLEKII